MNIPTVGGLFAIMTLFHFLFDWIPQTESQAMNKHKDGDTLFLHSLFYSFPTATVLWLLSGTTFGMLLLIFFILFISHLLEDTYWLPVWWMVNVRRTTRPIAEGFNLVLLVVIDQLVHLLVLLICCSLVV